MFTSQITSLPRRHNGPLIVAVSGFGGSGKSTLAALLKEQLKTAAVIPADDFIMYRAKERSADWSSYDRLRLQKQVLEPARRGQTIRYQMYDWQHDRLGQWRTVPKAEYLIVEGLSILHPDLRKYYDFSIWVDCPLEVATQRGIERDRRAGNDHDDLWLKIWMPNERDFFEKYKPAEAANIVYNTYEGVQMTDAETAHQLTLVEPTNPLLNKKSKEITTEELSSPYIQAVIDRMFVMAAGKGHGKHDSRQMVGLAAPQLGLNKRIIFIDVTADGSNKEQNLHEVINPRITSRSKETMPGREGCWSCGNICGQVERAKKVTLEGLDRHGKPVKYEFTDFVARIAQHETDHLDGTRFPDRIPANEPEHLHWVLPEQFPDYRVNWMHWKQLCPRERWEKMKAGL